MIKGFPPRLTWNLRMECVLDMLETAVTLTVITVHIRSLNMSESVNMLFLCRFLI